LPFQGSIRCPWINDTYNVCICQAQ
jgi:hypothetical protein